MITIYPSADDVADAAADIIGATIAESDHLLTIGLAGGSTPAATYRRLAAGNHDWNRVMLWLGDERWVVADDPESNTRMVRETLGTAADRLVAPDTTLDDPELTALAYAGSLAHHLSRERVDGRPDLVLLGMGDDGHTASLFPGTPALEERDLIYVANWVDSKDTWRLTATLPLLWSARRTLFLVTGPNKAEMLARVLDADEPFPSQRVAAGAPNVRWLLDEAAAAHLADGPDRMRGLP